MEQTQLSQTWSSTGRFDGSPYLTSLRGKDPKRTSTVTMHVAKEGGPAPTGCAGVRSHHFGPGVKVVGGQVMYSYEERSTGKLPRSLDPAEILREYLTAPRPTTSPGGAGLNGTGTASEGSAARPSTSYEPRAYGGRGRSNPAFAPRVDKVVYFDGTRHHVIDKPEAGGGAESAWQPPHLEHPDVEPGHFLGVRETGGAPGVSLVGSKYRLMPDRKTQPTQATYSGTNLYRTGGLTGPIPPPYGANKGPYGLKPYAPVNQTTSFGTNGNINEHSLRAYAKFKLMGHKEYEGTCKQLVGIQAWTGADCDLTTSMSHGHSTRLLAPQEHIVSKLSLRRTGAF